MLTYGEPRHPEKEPLTMQPQDLKMATTVTGYQLFLFVTYIELSLIHI